MALFFKELHSRAGDTLLKLVDSGFVWFSATLDANELICAF